MKYYSRCIHFIFVPQHLGLNCESLCIAGLDDCSILRTRHLVRNRLGGMHDLINIQNLISHSFACHEWSGHEPRDQRALSLARYEANMSIQRDSVPKQLRTIKVFECLVR
jgi:hypothetical protein